MPAQKPKAKAKKKPKVKPIPKGYHTATPYLFIKDAAGAIEFYKAAFKAKEVMRVPGPGGRVGHAEIKIGNSPIMLAEENPGMGARGPKTLGGSPVMLHLYVKDVDAVVEQAAAAGRSYPGPLLISSTATGPAGLKIRSAMSGMWPVARKTCRPRNCGNAQRWQWPHTAKKENDRYVIREDATAAEKSVSRRGRGQSA